MKHFKITETCSCGAKLEFEEIVDHTYNARHSDCQIRFHEEHKKCRNYTSPK